jgi:gamma-glutamyltranspeptidase/glutathione hydrolase
MYNGCMGVFDPRPGRPGSIAPGKARWSSICPSIVFKDGKAERVAVTLGLRQVETELVEVRSGVAAGDVLILGSAKGVAAGTPVKVIG